MGVNDSIESLAVFLYERYFAHLFGSDVVFVTAQIKREVPHYSNDGRRSVGFFRSGKAHEINSSFDKTDFTHAHTSSRSFIFNLASENIIGGSDDFSIRIPFVSALFHDPFALKREGELHTPITKICAEFVEPLIIPSIKNGKSNDSMVIKLLLKSNRKGIEFNYFNVDYIAFSGFLAHAKNSAIQLPSVLGYEPILDGPVPEQDGNELNDIAEEEV